jgi:hypothetical protein
MILSNLLRLQIRTNTFVQMSATNNKTTLLPGYYASNYNYAHRFSESSRRLGKCIRIGISIKARMRREN